MSKYGIVDLTDKEDTEIVDFEDITEVEQPNDKPNDRANEQPNALSLYNINITTLDLLFNYINKGDSENLSLEDFKEMKICKKDRPGILNWIKRLGVFISDTDIFQYMSEDRILDFKIQYWVIKEIYNSPHKALLSKITKNKFEFRFLKAKKYKDFTNLDDFTAYFIKCLQNELEAA